MRIALSQYALHIGVALFALIAAFAAWAVLHRSGWVRRSGGRFEEEGHVGHYDFDRELEALRRELQHSIEANQATARRTAEIGENVISAVRPIYSALRDMSSRIAGLERRADVSDELSADLKSSLRGQESSSEENARIVEGINVRLGRFEQQLAATSDQLLSLNWMTEATTARNKENSEELSTINTGLAAVQRQMGGLSQRVDLGQKDQTDLSTRIWSMADLIASLKSSSEQAAQQLADLERRFASKPALPEVVPN